MSVGHGIAKRPAAVSLTIPLAQSPTLTHTAAAIAAIAVDTEAAAAAVWTELRQYGEQADDRLRLYSASALPSDHAGCLVVYVHGGMWQALRSVESTAIACAMTTWLMLTTWLRSMADSGFLALPLVAHGHALAAVEYTLAPHGVSLSLAWQPVAARLCVCVRMSVCLCVSERERDGQRV